MRSHYAMSRINDVKGVTAPAFQSPHFKEFVVNFDETITSVEEINEALLEQGIFGGKDISSEFPELGSSALYCVTEIHTKNDIDILVKALMEVVE